MPVFVRLVQSVQYNSKFLWYCVSVQQWVSVVLCFSLTVSFCGVVFQVNSKFMWYCVPVQQFVSSLGPFRFLSKIRGDIREWMLITSVNNTCDKLFTGVNDTGDTFIAGVNKIWQKIISQDFSLLSPVLFVDTADKHSFANISANFLKYSKWS